MKFHSKLFLLAVSFIVLFQWFGVAKCCGDSKYDKNITILLPGPKDIGSGCSSNTELWQFGGINGHCLAIGQPNSLNRRDRVIVRFDISKYINKGKIQWAILSFSLQQFGRLRKKEVLQLEHFTVERQILSGADLISTQTEKVKEFSLNPKNMKVIDFSFNVTALVNADLSKGFGGITFRLISNSADKFGNAFKAATGATVVNGSVKLRVSK